MFCQNCGGRIDGDCLFCEACGARQDGGAPAPTPAPAPAPSPAPALAPTPFCQNCGSRIDGDCLFCEACGARRDGGAPAPTLTLTPPPAPPPLAPPPPMPPPAPWQESSEGEQGEQKPSKKTRNVVIAAAALACIAVFAAVLVFRHRAAQGGAMGQAAQSKPAPAIPGGARLRVAFSRAIPAAPGRDGNWGSWEGSLVGDLVVGGEVLWAAGTKAEGVIQYRNRPTFLILKRLGGAEVQRAYQVASDYAKEAGLRNGNRDSVAVAFRAALGSESKLMRCPPVTFQIAE